MIATDFQLGGDSERANKNALGYSWTAEINF